MNIKKIVVIMVLSISAVSFAKARLAGNSNIKNSGQKFIMQQMVVLTPEQQKEFYKMNDAAMRKSQNYMIQIRETDLNIQKELLKDKPNIKKLNKLSNKKAAFEIKREQELLKHRIRVKEKFGIDNFKGAMNQRMISNANRNRPQYNKRLTSEQEQELINQNTAYRKERQEYRLQIREISNDIQNEMFSKNPDMKKIELLTEKRIKLQSEMEKHMLRNRLKLRENFEYYMIEDDIDDEIK
ncbi:hypothetical protein [uncultured Ilyobacter sp.]|uniref:hypothetical protein n=1 Tax=uncultured Ilyobacter sp. TaxID=544433 RepID=UPI0029C8A569|nr:hypothetical protein [uncultured Ilyobacter sp.]